MSKKANDEESVEQLLTMEEVMRSLRVSRSKLYLMATTGELRALRAGRNLRFRKRDVQALIEKWAAEGQKPKGHKKKGRA